MRISSTFDNTPSSALADVWRETKFHEMIMCDGFLPNSSIKESYRVFREQYGVDIFLAGYKSYNLPPPDMPEYILGKSRGRSADEYFGFLDEINFIRHDGVRITLVYHSVRYLSEPDYFHFSCSDPTVRAKYRKYADRLKRMVKKCNEWKAAEYAAYTQTVEGAYEHACDIVGDLCEDIPVPHEYEHVRGVTGNRSHSSMYYRDRTGKEDLLVFKYSANDYKSDYIISLTYHTSNDKLRSDLDKHFEKAFEAIKAFEELKMFTLLRGDKE